MARLDNARLSGMEKRTNSGALQTDGVALEPVTCDRASTLGNLFELYVYDFSEHMPLRIEASGRFELTPGDVWWTRADHFAYFIKLHGELAGFALVRAGSRVTNESDVMDVAEFFVLRGIRGKGIGKSAAHALFRAFPGAWEVRVRRTNVAALQFWSRVAESWARQPVSSSTFSVEGIDWDLLSGSTPAAKPAPRNQGCLESVARSASQHVSANAFSNVIILGLHLTPEGDDPRLDEVLGAIAGLSLPVLCVSPDESECAAAAQRGFTPKRARFETLMQDGWLTHAH